MESVQVKIHRGLDGDTLQLSLVPEMSFATVVQQLLEQMSAEPSLSAVLSAEGLRIESTGDLLEFQSKGSLIFATLVRPVEKMSLSQVAEELALPDQEFRGHLFVLSKYKSGFTYRDVANYLSRNQVFLTGTQATQVFHQLLPKISAQVPEEGRDPGLRGQLIMALHTFCLDPYAIWEVDDGQAECLWAHMEYNGRHLGASGRFCLPGQISKNFLKAAGSFSSEVQDVSNLRGVLQARREGGKELDRLVPVRCNGFDALKA
ncbi:unnamed protein product [Effrenium voratum]|nr:unnamed protein product [Effrenium voratum]|mmetsp:Transcript_32879/g.78725  ORF Transcript_32879/g.78725 Transcript_32879/m.78725 type:complete len:261 (-) Transcript_32879:142-924(-)